MTDNPAAEAEPAPPADRREAVRWFSGWSEERRRNIFLIVYAFAFLVTAAAIWLVAVAPGASGEGARAAAGRAVLAILGVNLLLIGGLAVAVGRRALTLFRRRTDAGARLHLRFVTLFSMVALVPAVLVALVFGVLVNRGVDQWFSDNVQSAVENGARIGEAYLEDVSHEMDGDLAVIAAQLGTVQPLFENRIQFSDALGQIAELFGYPAIYILGPDGEVLASGEIPGACPMWPRPARCWRRPPTVAPRPSR